MATIGISEFTFGFAFLHEQTARRWGSLTAAPVLPSLLQEQEEGWDARLPLTGTAFYYQFKLSDYLTNWNAKYIRRGPYVGHYYRIALLKKEHNRQHRRLRQHCLLNPYTYYVAPEFNSLEVFNAGFLSHRIGERSRLIPLSLCDDIYDGTQHYITFQHGHAAWIQHSEPRRHEKSYSGKDLETLFTESESDWKRLDDRYFEKLFDQTRESAAGAIKREPGRSDRIPVLDLPTKGANRRVLLSRTSEILSAVFGLTMVLVGTKA